MLTGIHFLLTYQCTYECDHCFVWSSPSAPGTFTAARLRELLAEARTIGTIDEIYFEGGEAFLFYPLLLEGIREARRHGFRVGVVTNGYFATTADDAELWLAPLAALGVAQLEISNDAFHSASPADSPASRATEAARRLGLSVDTICIEGPTTTAAADARPRGAPIVGGGVRFRGRATERLAEGLPRVGWQELTECPYEDLRAPGRLHVDPYEHVHLCQGLSLGNARSTPLSELVARYRAEDHPIASSLVAGGPAQLVRDHDLPHEAAYVDACHLCYRARQALLDRFPEQLAPPQVYGR